MPLNLKINGEMRSVLDLSDPAGLENVLLALSIRKDLVAVALNDMIISRSEWVKTFVSADDRMEIVHFVGGGNS